jgi:hypothetical protein
MGRGKGERRREGKRGKRFLKREGKGQERVCGAKPNRCLQ